MNVASPFLSQTVQHSRYPVSTLPNRQVEGALPNGLLRIHEPGVARNGSRTPKKDSTKTRFRIKSKSECHLLSHSGDTSKPNLARAEDLEARSAGQARRWVKEAYYERHNMAQNSELKDIISHMYKLDSIKNSKSLVKK